MANAIQVVLTKSVPSLGSEGEVVRVRPGYARNYLVPRGMAVLATAENLARIEALRRQALARAADELGRAKQLAERLETVSLKLERAVGSENRMYGSVTARDIEQACADLGIEVDRRRIELGEPIKTLGQHQVSVRLHPEVRATLRIEVVRKT